VGHVKEKLGWLKKGKREDGWTGFWAGCRNKKGQKKERKEKEREEERSWPT
jgi:hypothetical protein